jgi:hypothetical protein
MSDQATSPRQVLVNATESSSQSLPFTGAPLVSRRSIALAQVIDFALKPPVILLVLVTFVVSHGITQGEFFYHGDEMSHAMNGVFFRDSLTDLPLQHPLQYVTEYYAKYPALAFPHWPPLFHFIEGVFFAIFGLSPWVSRLTVLCFALLAAYFWYRIAERLGPRYRAFLSAVILTCAPFILLYERVTMLEIPALAVCLGAIHFWLRFLESERRRDLWMLAGFVVGAFLISQKAIFLVFFIGFDLMIERRFRLLKKIDVWLALLTSMVGVLPWYVLASQTMTTLLSRVIAHGYSYLTVAYNYTFYPIKVYQQLGPLVVCLACVGIVFALLKPSRANRILLTWVVSGYLCFSLVSEKDPRHTILWIPPLLYLALLALDLLLARRSVVLAASSAVALFFFIAAFRSERPKISGLEEVARYVLSLPESDIVYYQGDLDGDFIFWVRKFDPERQHMVAREKQIVVSRLGWRPREVLHTQEEVLSLFRTWGIRYAVVEDQDPFPGLTPVRQLLNSDQFDLLRTVPLLTNQVNLLGRQIQVFRYRGELHRTQQSVEIPMMTIRHNIAADLSRLAGRPWPN